jgi:hypothetical protein
MTTTTAGPQTDPRDAIPNRQNPLAHTAATRFVAGRAGVEPTIS